MFAHLSGFAILVVGVLLAVFFILCSGIDIVKNGVDIGGEKSP